jgi:hypothetical protein
MPRLPSDTVQQRQTLHGAHKILIYMDKNYVSRLNAASLQATLHTP